MTTSNTFDRTTVTVPLAIPVLLTTDIKRAAETYAGIGFDVIEAAHNYLVLRREGVELHISHVAHIPEPHCVSAYIRVADVAQWHSAFTNGRAKRLSAPADKPWGLREFHFIDEDGNLLNVGQILA
jgi:catechol 2,3-dioxygenase-like lactoylglutathione lyase family enzyme